MTPRQFHSTPPKPTPRGYIQYSTRPVPLAQARKQQLRENMQGYVLGPMDPNEFMRSFMPVNAKNSPTPYNPPDGIDFREVYEQDNERSMYAPFVRRRIVSQQYHTDTVYHTDSHRKWGMYQLYGKVHWRSGGS